MAFLPTVAKPEPLTMASRNLAPGDSSILRALSSPPLPECALL